MNVIIEKETKITLILNQEEALWLRQVVQNPINSTHEEEAPLDSDMRGCFFKVLEEV